MFTKCNVYKAVPSCAAKRYRLSDPRRRVERVPLRAHAGTRHDLYTAVLSLQNGNQHLTLFLYPQAGRRSPWTARFQHTAVLLLHAMRKVHYEINFFHILLS